MVVLMRGLAYMLRVPLMGFYTLDGHGGGGVEVRGGAAGPRPSHAVISR